MRLGQLDQRFGVVPWHRAGVTDTAGLISDRQLTRLERWREYFQDRFPKANLSVFMRRQLPEVELRAYSFWLFNRGSFAGSVAQLGQNNLVLLTIDPGAGQAALTVGYGLEPYLSEEALQSVLEKASGAFRRGDYPGGIRRCIRALIPVLRDNLLAAGGGAPAPRAVQGTPALEEGPY